MSAAPPSSRRSSSSLTAIDPLSPGFHAELEDAAGGGDGDRDGDAGGMRFGDPGEDRDDDTRPQGLLAAMLAGLPDLRGTELLGADADDFPIAVRIDAAATVIEARGRTEDLVSAVSYVSRLADVIGATLGVGDVVALHGVGADEQIVFGRSPGGEVLALAGRAQATPADLLHRIGL